MHSDLTHFLEDPRIVRIFSVIWFNGCDFLDPNFTFERPLIDVDILFDRLWSEPARLYFSPIGKLLLRFIVYLVCVILLSFMTLERNYTYMPFSEIEGCIYFLALFAIAYEIHKIVDSPRAYIAIKANYLEFPIILMWFFMAVLGIYGINSDNARNINEIKCIMYMFLYGWMAIIIWCKGFVRMIHI